MADLREDIRDYKSDTNSSILLLIAEVGEEFRNIKRRLAESREVFDAFVNTSIVFFRTPEKESPS